VQHYLRDAIQTMERCEHKKIEALRGVQHHLCDAPPTMLRYKHRLLKLLLVTLQNVSSQWTERNYDCVARSWNHFPANVASDGLLDKMRRQNQVLHWDFEATSDNIDGPVVVNPPNIM